MANGLSCLQRSMRRLGKLTMVPPVSRSVSVLALALAGCSATMSGGADRPAQADSVGAGHPQALVANLTPSAHARTQALFGDLHLHTAFSFDAFTFKTTATPDDAYAFAQGAPLQHPSGGTYQLDRPFDFLAVTDHSEFMGVVRTMADPSSPLHSLPIAQRILSPDAKVAAAAFHEMVGALLGGTIDKLFGTGPEVSGAITDAWEREKAAANRAYKPGKFTSLIGYEWTAQSEGRNLHRNVLFRGDDAPLPFAATQSNDPEMLWQFLDNLRGRGFSVMAIPHNSNASDGTMFGTSTFTGKPITRDYAITRSRNEPIAEITQVKGTSETHPSLSPNDEFANFEILPTYIAMSKKVTKFAGGYIRDAWRTGLTMQDGEGFNPYNFGVIGSTDSHVGMSPVLEYNYWGKVGVLDGTAAARYDCTYCTGSNYRNFSASGLAAVWSTANTREAIFDALQRKETYGTTGPRMQVRFFAGWNLAGIAPGRSGWLTRAYAGGVPMGGTLQPGSAGKGSPTFLVSAMKDPVGANLDRVQIIKLWSANGQSHEKIFDVALSGGRKVDPRTGKAPPVGDSIDRATLKTANTIGAPSFMLAWKDPEFDPAVRAAYYVRVLEIPTPRWSTWDAKRLGKPVKDDQPFAIQERAFTSPIWYDTRRAPTRS